MAISTNMLAMLVLLATLTPLCTANPAIEHAFRRYVNSNDCLRGCMKPIEESERDIAIFKQSNYADYLLNLDSTCATIETARACIDSCGIKSNPFALQSVTHICGAEARKDVASLSECLSAHGERVHEECAATCGSKFETINEALRAATVTAKPDNARTHSELMKMSGDACTSLKCTSRCAIAAYNLRCAPTSTSSSAAAAAQFAERAGDTLKRIIEGVLHAHRADLEAHGLAETMMTTIAPECNYHYAPHALFSPQIDAQTLQAARQLASSSPSTAPQQQQAQQPSAVAPSSSADRTLSPNAVAAESEQLVAALKANAARRISFTLSQMQMRLLEKQMDVLDKQGRNLDRDFDKTNFELARMLYKPRGPMFFGPPPAFF